MNLRECATQICHENGMDQEEIDNFLAWADANGTSGGKEDCIRRTVEELTEENQKIFMNSMRKVVPIQVERFRKEAGQQSITA